MTRCHYLYAIIRDRTIYIGQATNPRKRWREHCHAAKHGSDLPLHRALRKYGQDAFQFRVVNTEPLLTTVAVDEAEIAAIAKCRASTLRRLHANPEFRAEHSARAREHMSRLNADPALHAAMTNPIFLAKRGAAIAAGIARRRAEMGVR